MPQIVIFFYLCETHSTYFGETAIFANRTLMPGMRLLRNSSNCLSSSRVPGQIANMSSRRRLMYFGHTFTVVVWLLFHRACTKMAVFYIFYSVFLAQKRLMYIYGHDIFSPSMHRKCHFCTSHQKSDVIIGLVQLP